MSPGAVARGFEDSQDAGEMLAVLPVEQRRALTVIFGGGSAAAAARKAHVSRSTVYRWKEGNARFMAVLNAWRSESKTSREDRMRAMGDLALNNVYNKLLDGDAKASLALLRLLASQDKNRRFITDPEKVARRIEARKKVKSKPAEASLPSEVKPAPIAPAVHVAPAPAPIVPSALSAPAKPAPIASVAPAAPAASSAVAKPDAADAPAPPDTIGAIMDALVQHLTEQAMIMHGIKSFDPPADVSQE
jgi:hypothetical protein